MEPTLVGLLVLLVVFLIGRSLVLWYWRVNDIITRLDAIAVALNKVQQVEVVVRSQEGGQILFYPVNSPPVP